jgi:hypothetical protein
MRKPLLIDQVAVRDLGRCGLIPLLSKSGLECCLSQMSFESPDKFENLKKDFETGGNVLREVSLNEISHNQLRFIYKELNSEGLISFYDAVTLALAVTNDYAILAADPVIVDIAEKLGIEHWSYYTLLSKMVQEKAFSLGEAIEYAYQLHYFINPMSTFSDSFTPEHEITAVIKSMFGIRPVEDDPDYMGSHEAV